MSVHATIINGVLGTKAREKGLQLKRLGFCVCGGEFACAGAGKLENRSGVLVLQCGNRHEEVTRAEANSCNSRTDHSH